MAEPTTAEVVADEFGAELKQYGFDPSIVIAIITAVIQLLGGKTKEGATPEDLQDCCKRRPLLTEAQLRRELAQQGVPIRLRARAAHAALEIGGNAAPEKFSAFASACN